MKKLSVSAIKKGTVIDHIPAGLALDLVQLLEFSIASSQVTIGMNLCSVTYGRKDLVKIEDRQLSPEQANRVALIAPEATIAIIENYEVLRKFKVVLPDSIRGNLPCPNPRCITKAEPMPTQFEVQATRAGSELICHFCKHSFRLTRSQTPLQEASLWGNY